MIEAASAKSGQDQKKKRAQGVFPRISLSKALELPRAIFELGEGEKVRRLSVFNRLERSPESGSARTLIASANGGYGLTTGSSQSEYLEITERGKKVIAPVSVLSKYTSIYDALFQNEIFAAFMTHFYQKSLRNDEVAIDYLKDNHDLSEQDARAFLVVIKENLTDYGLVQEFSGRQVIISRDVAMDNLQKAGSDENINTAEAPAQIDQPVAPVASVGTVVSLPNTSSKVDPQFHFNIQIHLPDNSAPEVYEAIFKSIAIHLLGRE